MDGPEAAADWKGMYEEAYRLWRGGRLQEAQGLLQRMHEGFGQRSLQSGLLLASIHRERKEILSEIEVLTDILGTEPFAPRENGAVADAWSMLGEACHRIGRGREAVAAFQEAAARSPGWEQKLAECSNAIFAANAVPGVEPAEWSRLYAAYRGLLADVRPYPRQSYGHRRLRVGYLSSDFCRHPVAYLIYPLLRYFDRELFSVFCYSNQRRADDVTRWLQGCPVHWRDVSAMGRAETAECIRRDEIDLLIDLGGHTSHSCLPVLAWRPAAVQLSGIGYMGSTGLSVVDGFLTDVHCAPRGASSFFTEELLPLPHTHLCYAPFGDFPEARPSPCLAKGYVTFGCFNHFGKITDRILALWSEILARTGNSRLLLKHGLYGSGEGRRYAASCLRAAGIPLERVEFRGWTEDWLTDYGDVDIALDTFPYVGGMTTLEALYMGVPVVSLYGGRPGTRFGLSILENLSLEELAAGSPEAYVETAVALAASRDLLGALHGQLRGRMLRSRLMDGPAYAREMERLYLQAFRRCVPAASREE